VAIISNATTIADAGAFSVGLGSMVLIKTITASASATLSFVHGTDGVVLDSTYPIYKFEFINIHPATNNVKFQFNLTTDGTNFNVTKTSTYFAAYHSEADDAGLAYSTGSDLAQSTSDQPIAEDVGSDNDQAPSGSLFLFNPSSTTFVKHYLANMSNSQQTDYSQNIFSAGYGNTTSAITGARFKFASGNIDSGKIKLYGIKDS
jgi:hypothetical protein